VIPYIWVSCLLPAGLLKKNAYLVHGFPVQVGNVYVLFKEEEQAATALRALQGRFYAGL
jgi:hypothetical protein